MRTKYNHPVANPGGFYPELTYEKKKPVTDPISEKKFDPDPTLEKKPGYRSFLPFYP